MKRMLFEFGRLNRKIANPAVLFILSGLCLASITFPGMAFLFLPGLVLFLFASVNSTNKLTAWLGGWLVGLMKAGGAISWLFNSFPLSWINVSDPVTQLIFIGLFWFSCALFLGGGMGLVAIAVRFLWKRCGAKSLIVFPVVWLAGEVLGSFLLSVVVLGSGSYLNAYLVYGYVGLALGRLDLFYSSAFWGGIYGLTFSAAAVGALTFFVLKKGRWYFFYLVVFIFVSAASSFWLLKENQTKLSTDKVIVIETAFSASFLSTPEGLEYKEREVKEAVSAALHLKPDVILLPEDSRFTNGFVSTTSALDHLNREVEDTQTLIVDTARVEISNQSAVLRSFYYDLNVGGVFVIDKQFLVPQGEYPSYLFEKVLSWSGNSQSLDFIKRNLNYIPGPIQATELPSSLPGTLFCFESASGVGVKKLDHQRSSLVLHPISHARFHSPLSMFYQLDTMLRIQAIWNGVTIVSAGNLSSSRAYLPTGEIVDGAVLEESDKWKLIEFEVASE